MIATLVIAASVLFLIDAAASGARARCRHKVSSVTALRGAGRALRFTRKSAGVVASMASYSINKKAVAHARQLIKARRYVLDSDWGSVQPTAESENAFLKAHSWPEYSEWHLGLTDDASDETKARYAFVYGDFNRVHRTALIACVFRASEWRHKEIELAAHNLLQLLDKTST